MLSIFSRNLDETTKSVYKENVRLSESLNYHMKEGEMLKKIKERLEEENEKLKGDKELNEMMVQEKVVQTKNQKQQIRDVITTIDWLIYWLIDSFILWPTNQFIHVFHFLWHYSEKGFDYILLINGTDHVIHRFEKEMRSVTINVAQPNQYHDFKRKTSHTHNWAPASEFVSSSIPSWQILTAHAQPFAWTFAARIGDKYQIRLTRSN